MKWHVDTSELRGPNNENKMSTFRLNYIAIDSSTPRLLMVRVVLVICDVYSGLFETLRP